MRCALLVALFFSCMVAPAFAASGGSICDWLNIGLCATVTSGNALLTSSAPAPTGSRGIVDGAATVTSTSSTLLVAGATNEKVGLGGWSCNNSGSTSVTVTFQDGSGGTGIGPILEVPAGGANNMAPGAIWATTSSGNGLYFAAGGNTTSLSCGITGTQQ